MLRFLQRLLGWDQQSTPRRPGEERRSTPRTSAASVLASEHAKATTRPAPVAPPPKKQSTVPELSLEDLDPAMLEGEGGGNNPYDTGRFKRPDAWNRVKKSEDQ